MCNCLPEIKSLYQTPFAYETDKSTFPTAQDGRMITLWPNSFLHLNRQRKEIEAKYKILF